MELWENLGEIIWAGANGELVEPVPTAKFSAEVLLKIKADRGGNWRKCEIPENLRQWIKFSGHCEVDGLAWFAPDDDNDGACGWMVAIGDTPEEVLETMKEQIGELPDGLTTDIAPLADVINAIDSGEEAGVEFAKEPMPEPGEVLETT
jgi:hypothetical protein